MTTPAIITVAITGAVPRKTDNPAVPITPDEQIASTREAFAAGASVVHIHVRNDDESSSSDVGRFAAVQAGIREARTSTASQRCRPGSARPAPG